MVGMRNRFFPILVALMIFSGLWAYNIQAQTGFCSDTLFFEDFSSGLPSSWENLDYDSLPDHFNRPADWFTAAHAPSSHPGFSNIAAGSSSWFSAPGAANNWLILDSLTVADTNLFLYWKSAPQEGPVYMDGYSVWLSTQPTLPIDTLETEIFRVAEGIGSTTTPGPGMVHTRFFKGQGLFQDWKVSLNPWIGQMIWITFVHDSEGDNMIFLDDIWVGTRPEVDLAPFEIDYNFDYTQVPEGHIYQLKYFGSIANQGLVAQPAGTLHLDIDRDGVPVFSTTESYPALAVDATAEVEFFDQYLPSLQGIYQIKTYTEALDSCGANDTFQLDLAVTDSIFARDNGEINGALSVGNAEGMLGNIFTLLTSDTLTSVDFYLGYPRAGDTLQAVVYTAGPGGPVSEIAQSEELIVGATAGWYRIEWSNGDIPLSFGDYFIGLKETQNGRTGLATAAGKQDPEGSWVNGDGIWTQARNYGARGPFMIRANFGAARLGIGIDDRIDAPSVTAYPNPSDGFFRLAGYDSVDPPAGFDHLGRQVPLDCKYEGNGRWALTPTANFSGLLTLRLAHEKHFHYSKILILR